MSSPATYSRMRNVPSVGMRSVGFDVAASPPMPSSSLTPATSLARGSTVNSTVSPR